MSLWIAMGILAAAAAAVSLSPLFRTSRTASTNAGASEIYRDQLRELVRDVERGLIGKAEAEAARVEIARRLLHAEQTDEKAASGGKPWRFAAAAVIIAAPVAAAGVYFLIGSPLLADRPLSERSVEANDQAEFDALIARVEAHLAENPGDGDGWEIIAPVYARMGRYGDAATAFSRALAQLGATSVREANYGEALVWANDGLIGDDARAAFGRALDIDPGSIRPRFYLASAFEQDGDDVGAAKAWRDLLADAEPGKTWVTAAEEALADVEARLGGDVAKPRVADQDLKGPSAEDVAAAADLSADDRLSMIETMVASLAARLETGAADARGWSRLIRSYVVLDQKAAAEAALVKARTALAGDSEGFALVEATAREIGLPLAGEQAE